MLINSLIHSFLMLFVKKDGKLCKLAETPFDLERDIQSVTEKSLNDVFGLSFVRSEFELNGLRIDSFAFDPESKAFVIIEYKKDRNFSVIDQGFAYLSSMLNNRAEFVLEYNKKMTASLTKDDIDWSQSRVLFIAPSFTTYQQKAIHFKDLPIELWEVKQFKNEIISYNKLTAPESSESIETLSKTPMVKAVSKEVKVYTEEDHLNSASEKTKEMYVALRDQILSLGNDIQIVPRKWYVGFKRKSNFVDITFQKSGLKLFLNVEKGALDDPRNLARDVSNIGHWGNGDYEIPITNGSDLFYPMSLIKEAYNRN